MTITAIRKDLEACTMTVTAEFDSPVDRVWQVWADPRQLERWWGPPMWPATFTEHSLQVGAVCRYHMTGPEGEASNGWWQIRQVDAPVYLELDDGFADADGNRNAEMPTMVMRVSLAPRATGGTRMSIETTFPSAEALVSLVEMGMEEGLSAAMGQLDDILAE